MPPQNTIRINENLTFEVAPEEPVKVAFDDFEFTIIDKDSIFFTSVDFEYTSEEAPIKCVKPLKKFTNFLLEVSSETLPTQLKGNVDSSFAEQLAEIGFEVTPEDTDPSHCGVKIAIKDLIENLN